MFSSGSRGQEKRLPSPSAGKPRCGPTEHGLSAEPLLADALSREPECGGFSAQGTEAATLSPQSLTGHTSPVESVRLNTPEELIVAGSQSGSIRVWDLEAAKSRHLCSPSPNRACGGVFSGFAIELLPPGSLS